VPGTNARLYVNGATQPVLIVNDLKQPPVKGCNRIVGGAGDDRAFCWAESFAVKPQAKACAAPTALGGLAHFVPKADALG
jgi:hypothetical protein